MLILSKNLEEVNSHYKISVEGIDFINSYIKEKFQVDIKEVKNLDKIFF